ncbi:MAG: hypothetical protein ACHQ50_15415, partial [Fimbriimonadales bacterium]
MTSSQGTKSASFLSRAWAPRELVTLWDEYAALLDQLVANDKQIAANTETYRATVHEIEPLIADLV